MYISNIRPRELRKTSDTKRKSGATHKESSEELEAIVDIIDIEGIDPDQGRDEPKQNKKKSPLVVTTDDGNLSITA